ncbi:type VI secretion system baseplate subunit TssK [Catalinimonas sp. 4WD22]|uniref:type VI secretion system baseplate subunit TssK n=1 Tax=Catalinimonas locisalis TaxID=3133978 RepID=UPI00310144A0
MHPNLRKASVNWIDGMKVNKDHFLQTEDWVIDHLKDIAALRLTDNEYGLLPASGDVDTSVNFQIDIEQTQFVKVTLLSCRAITRGGIRIEITPYISKLYSLERNQFEVKYDLKNASNQQYAIVITVDPYHRIPVGDPNPEEHPLRHPFSIPKYSVDIIPSKEVNSEEFSTYHLTIGKFRVVGGEVQVEDYIPPCTSMSSHPTLVEYYREFETLLNEIRQSLTQFIKKNRALDDRSINHNVLALSESMLMTMAIYQDEFQLEVPTKSPIHIFKFFLRYIRLISTELNCMPEDDRLNVYNTFNRSFAAGTFENMIHNILNLKYSHRQIYQVIAMLHQEISTFNEILSKLPYSSTTAYERPREEPEPQAEQPAPKKMGSTVKIFRGGREL